MTKTMEGSPDGCRVETYEAGKEYEFLHAQGVDLARVFVREEWAVEVVDAVDEPEKVEVEDEPDTAEPDKVDEPVTKQMPKARTRGKKSER